MNYYSRLNRKKDKQTIVQIGLIIFFTVILIIGLFKFGLPLLFNLTSSILNLRPKNSLLIDKSLEIVSPPIIDIPYTATTSSSIKISIHSDPESNVSIYLNDIVLETRLTDSNGKSDFSFDLSPGLNRIYAQTIHSDGQKSANSTPIDISYISKPPKLEIESPVDKQVFNSSDAILISGITDPKTNVEVNDRTAIVQSDGKFSLFYRLTSGENKLKFEATDQANNKTQKELTAYLQL